MLAVMNSIGGRFYGFLTNYIYVRRSGLRLPATVSLLDPKKRGVTTQYLPFEQQTPDSLTMRGYLHEISKAELSLIVPSVHFGKHDLIDCSNYTLQISVEFLNRTINIQAAPVRFNKLDESRYLIGADITEMTDSDRRHLVQYIKSGKVMREFMDSAVRHLYRLLANRNRVRRNNMHLPMTVSLLDLGKNPVVAHCPATRSGFLRDITRTGLSLAVPSVSFGDRFITDGYCEMRIIVELSNGTVSIQAAPVRYDKLDEPQSQCKYIIGARITQMADSDRKRLAQCIQQVKKSKPEASKTSFAHDAESF